MHWRYLIYVLRHKWYVLRAGWSLNVPLLLLLIHDWTKFFPREWFPYAQFFYGLPKVGDRVWVDCVDGFSGRGTVIEQRFDKNSRYKVRMENGYIGEGQEFWSHDFEVDGLDAAKAMFDAAWNHHQKRNPHHWQYWLLTLDSGETVPLRMPERCIREMVADWIGAGWAIRNCSGLVDARNAAKDWYANNEDRMQLEQATRSKVEELL